MADGIILNEQEYNRFRRMLFEYERDRGGRVQVRRRRGIMGGGDGVVYEMAAANIVRDLKRDNPDRIYPTGCTWGTPDDPWLLEDQDYYIALLSDDTTEVYNPSTFYVAGGFCLFEVLADSVIDEDFADIGYGYQLKYKCTDDTTGSFDYTKWVLVDAYSEGQWKIKFPVGESSVVDMRNYLPWFKLDALLPIIEINGDYLFWQTFTPIGAGGNCSISWNQNEKRAQTTYK